MRIQTNLGLAALFMILAPMVVAGDPHDESCPRPLAAHTATVTTNQGVGPENSVKKQPFQQSLSERAQLRRLWLDLTGTIPPQDVVETYLADNNPLKVEAMVDQILTSQAYVARWTTFFDDTFWNHFLADNGFIRNNFHAKIRTMVEENLPVDELAKAILTTNGLMGEDQSANFFYIKEAFDEDYRLDYLDDQISFITDTMLGVQTTCISCHDGAYHLEQVNKGLSTMTREQFWGMAAFLAKSYFYIVRDDAETQDVDEFLRKIQLIDLEREGYDRRFGFLLLTEGSEMLGEYFAKSEPGEGMRPQRNGGLVQPAYFTTGEAPRPEESRREALARMVTSDRQFARNMVNRVWAHFMGKGFVNPVNGWDLGRINGDIATQNESTVQPQTPKLMEWLTDRFIAGQYDLKALIRDIVNGPAYRYEAKAAPGTWPNANVWRKQRQPRRLEAEAIVDAYYKIHRLPAKMMVTGILDRTFNSAWEMPGPYEPNIGAIFDQNYDQPLVNVRTLGYRDLNEYYFYQYVTTDVMGRFDRGQYDIGIARSENPSIQNSLTLLNHPEWNFWLEGGASTPFIQGAFQALVTGTEPEVVFTQIFREILFRDPNANELALIMAHRGQQGNERAVLDLMWSLFNHPDFLYR